MGFKKFGGQKGASTPFAREDQQKAEEKKKALIKQMFRKRTTAPAQSPPDPLAVPTEAPAPVAEAKSPPAPLSTAQYGQAKVAVYDRDVPAIPLTAEPWLKQLANLMLNISCMGGMHLALMWPARIEFLPLAHSLAALERLAIKDLMGFRTIVYPVKQSSFYKLNHFLLDRPRLCALIRALWVSDDVGTRLQVVRQDDHNAKFLSALVSIQNYHAETPYPTAGELLPSFIFRPESGEWGNYQHRLLGRSITRLRLAHRQDVRSDAFPFVGSPESAPNALYGIPYGTKKDVWKKALRATPFGSSGRKPELTLIDATDEMRDMDRRLTKRVADFIVVARETLGEEFGTLVITDNPATFFLLKKTLNDDLKENVSTHVIVNEFTGTGLSASPKPDDYVPATRSLRHYGFEILDREAAGVASKLIGIAKSIVDGSDAAQACSDAAHYILRLCYLPGGYRDLGEWLESDGRPEFAVARLAWATYEARLRNLIQAGNFASHTHSVEVALERAAKLISESWFEATPVALRLAKELASIAAKPGKRALVTLVKGAYIDIAKQFLRRQFSQSIPFEAFESRVTFTTPWELKNHLPFVADYDQVFFVGMNDRLLRLLVTSEEIPAGSSVLLSYAQAESYKSALLALKSIDRLKPFKGRVSQMADELEKRLKQMPSIALMDRLPTRGLSFDFESTKNFPERVHQELWRLDLEGGERIFVAKRVLGYQPDQDPPFAWALVAEVKVGDSIFVMSDDLRGLVEGALSEAGFTAFKKGHTFAGMLQLYHAEVKRRSKELFPAKTKREQCQKILSRMSEIDPNTRDCSIHRVLHWLDLDDDAPSERPQASRDLPHFEAFVRALAIPEALYKDFWVLAINTTRNESRLAGREMADFYTNVIFHPETLQVYHSIKSEVLARLMRAATDSVYRISAKVPPDQVRSSQPTRPK